MEVSSEFFFFFKYSVNSKKLIPPATRDGLSKADGNL